ncbi:MAG: radical SAM protein [Nannocystaceae bacterium]|nr:radical SAM protein [Nannocystaceae bacterium]
MPTGNRAARPRSPAARRARSSGNPAGSRADPTVGRRGPAPRCAALDSGSVIDDASPPALGPKRDEHERAAHQLRNWVRLTYDCNDRCVFCLDSDAHDGRIRDRHEIKAQILDGRRKGAQRLILSGGEPTIHPDFVDFVRLGRAAGYARVQTVTNGRMFAYPGFLQRALDAGLGEITFSIHGPDARIHDALVGVKGAYDEEITGLRAALADGRPIVNVDVCVNRANVRHLPRMLRGLRAMGVREFDLLHVIPFGRAWSQGEHTLFYDFEEARTELHEVFAMAGEPDVHLWLNRFPLEQLEGFEALIQDPYKLNDEVRGRREEYDRLLADGTPLPCREPARCRHCYVRRLCDHLDDTRAALAQADFARVRLDLRADAEPVARFGGDPASARKAAARRLPLAGAPATIDRERAIASARRLWLVAHDVAQARAALATVGAHRGALELELDTIAGLLEALDGDGRLDGATIERVHARDEAQARALLASPHRFEVLASIDRGLARWLDALPAAAPWPERLALVQPDRALASEAAAHDVPPAWFAAAAARWPDAPVEGVAPCILGRAPRPGPSTLDTAMLTPAGQLEIGRYAARFVAANDRVKSLRCRACALDGHCGGMAVNWVRAHGFGAMQPIAAPVCADADPPASRLG